MARNFNLNLNLRAILDSRGFRDLESNLQRVSRTAGSSLNGFSQTLDRLGPQAISLGRTLSTRVTLPIAALGAVSVRTFAQFEDGFRGVQTLLDDDAFGNIPLNEGLEQLQQGIARLNAEQGLGLTTLNSALFDTISAGVNASEAIGTLESAGRLAVAGLTDVSVATRGITSALNAYQISADQADQVAARFFNAQRAGQTTVQQLAEGFGTVGANAASAGVSLDELLGATAAITLGGVATNSAFTGLRATIANIQNPTSNAAQEASRLGIEFNAAALRAQGLEQFISNLVNSPNFGPDSINRLFSSVEAQGSLNALITQIDAFRDTTATLGDGASGVETLTNAFITQSGSFGQELSRLSSRFENFRNSIGEQLAPLVRTVTGALSSFFDAVERSPQLTTFVGIAGGAAAALGPLLITLGRLQPGISAVVSSLGNLTNSFSLTGAVSPFISALETLNQRFNTNRASISSFGASIVQSLRNSPTTIRNIANSAGELGRTFAGVAVAGVASLGQALAQLPSNSVRTLSNLRESALSLAEALSRRATASVSSFSQILRNIPLNTSLLFDNFGQSARSFGRALPSRLLGVFSIALSGIGAVLSVVTAAITTLLSPIGLVVAAFVALGVGLVEVERRTGAIGVIFNAIAEIVVSLLRSLLNLIGVNSDLLDSFSSLSQFLRDVFGRVIEGVVMAVSFLVRSVLRLVRTIGNLRPFGRPLISQSTLDNLNDAEERLNSIISPREGQSNVNVTATENTQASMDVADAIKDTAGAPVTAPVAPVLDENAVTQLRNRLAQIRLQNQQSIGEVDLNLVARVARDQFAEELANARRIGLDTAPIEQRIQLTVERAQFQELNADITSLTQRFDQARMTADDLQEAVGAVAAFEFRAQFAADNQEDTQQALQRLRQFRQNVQDQATANEIDRLILRLEAEQDDSAFLAVIARVERINQDLELEENQLRVRFRGDILDAELNEARVRAREQVEGIVADASQANPQINLEDFDRQATDLVEGYERIANARTITLGDQANDAIAGNLRSSLDTIVEGTETVGNAFEDLGRRIVQSLTSQALERSITNLLGGFSGGQGSGGGALGAIGSIFGARTGGLIQNGRLVTPAFANGGEIGKRARSIKSRIDSAMIKSLPAFQTGGPIQSRPNGLLNGPGTGTSDSILARVSNGEFVTNRQTTDFFGADFFSRLQDFARRGENPFSQLSFATGGLVNAFSSARSNLSNLSRIPRFQNGGPIERQDTGIQSPPVNIEIRNEGTGKQVGGVERDQVTGQITAIILRDVQENGAIAQNFQSAFGLNRQGQN